MLTEKEYQTLQYYEDHGEEWAEARKKLSELSFWHHEYLEFEQLKPQGKILEIGSGSGRESVELTSMGYAYIGIDPSQTLLTIARRTNPSCAFLHSTPYNLPFPPNTFDGFTSWALLPHLPKNQIGKALDGVKAVLKADAIGFIAMRQGSGEAQELKTGRWFSYYTHEEFEMILQSHGFATLKKGIKPSRPDLTWLTFFVKMV